MDAFLTAVYYTILAALAMIGLCVILEVIGRWMVYNKMREPGWKALIPVYSNYTLYREVWEAKYFWIVFAGSVIELALSGVTMDLLYTSATGYSMMIVVMSVVNLAIMAIRIVAMYKVSTAFGHGAGFAVGLYILPWLFFLILGVGKSEYIETVQ